MLTICWSRPLVHAFTKSVTCDVERLTMNYVQCYVSAVLFSGCPSVLRPSVSCSVFWSAR